MDVLKSTPKKDSSALEVGRAEFPDISRIWWSRVAIAALATKGINNAMLPEFSMAAEF